MRARMVRVQFWSSSKVTECSLQARLLFIGIWNISDDYGVFLNSNRRILGELFPSDNDENITTKEIDLWKKELIDNDLITELSVGKKSYIFVNDWKVHQKIQHPSKTNTWLGVEPEEHLGLRYDKELNKYILLNSVNLDPHESLNDVNLDPHESQLTEVEVEVEVQVEREKEVEVEVQTNINPSDKYPYVDFSEPLEKRKKKFEELVWSYNEGLKYTNSIVQSFIDYNSADNGLIMKKEEHEFFSIPNLLKGWVQEEIRRKPGTNWRSYQK
jgi:hypothetical protein